MPELAEGLGMCPRPLAGGKQAGGFQKLFNPWVLTHPVHHQAGSSARRSDVRGRPWHSAILPAHMAVWQTDRETEEPQNLRLLSPNHLVHARLADVSTFFK